MPDDVTILSTRRLFDRFLKIDEFVFRRTERPGCASVEETNFIMERGDSAAALVHDIERDVLILVRQFRVAVHSRGEPPLIELPAGAIEAGETPEACIRREIREETGYEAEALDIIATCFMSPGGTTERLHLFYAPVRPSLLRDQAARGVGDECLERLEVPRAEFVAAARSGSYRDAKTIIAGLWLASRPKEPASGPGSRS